MRKQRQHGFTLIEVIIYLALFAILFGGAIAAAYNVFESNGRNQTKAMVQEEGDFLIAKINGALSGAEAINSPPVGTPLAILSLTKYDNSSVTVRVSVSGSDMELQNTAGTFTLNNSNVEVSNLIFEHIGASGDGINPENVGATFTLRAKTPNGIEAHQDFSSRNYLRK